jgi:MFS transporter, NNP family, nitrate/nitrite transporter
MKDLQASESSNPGEGEPGALRFRIGALLFLVGIFFSNILARFALTPMMPIIEQDLHLGHGQAGALVFILSLGYSLLLLGSGFISSRLNHDKTIFVSCVAVTGAVAIIAFSHNLWGIWLGLLLLGMGAGLYLPSGIATITGMVVSRDWGKAIAIHELAPNLGFILSPLLLELLLRWCTWRQVLMSFGVVCLLMGIVFRRFGKGGNSPGEAPNIRTLRVILADRSFWLLMLSFCIAIGATFGVYSMLPLYLVAEKGVERVWANTWVGLSRIPSLFTGFVAGWATDRFGPKRTIGVVFLCAGISTVLLSIAPGAWFVPLVFFQAVFSTAYFPAGFAALSRVGSPKSKNVAFSLTMPVSIFIGAGAVPAGLGIAGDFGSFSVGFAIVGGFLLAGSFMIRFLTLPGKQ